MKPFAAIVVILFLGQTGRSEKINNEESTVIESIFDHLQSGIENIKLEGHSDLVLVLGNTGAGKSTLVQLVAGENDSLSSVELVSRSGEFVIVDKHGSISRNSTIVSQTFYPVLVVDPLTKQAFYDCPGFSDTRSPAHDISATYFTKKVIESAKRLKLIFVVNYSSVRIGIDRLDFIRLLKHITTVVKDVGKYRSSIALIVTKVENSYIKTSATSFEMVPDEKVTESIANFLTEVKNNVKAQSLSSPSEYNSTLTLLDIFLEKEGDVYKKIGILRRPDEVGPVSQIDLLQFCKRQIQNIIHNNTQFTLINDSDFGYSISADSKNYIRDLGRVINTKVRFAMTSVGEEIEEYFNLTENLIHNFHNLSENFILGKMMLSNFRSKIDLPLTNLTEAIAKDMEVLQIKISREIRSKLYNYGHLFTFLNIVGNQSLEDPLVWLQGLRETSKFLDDGHRWFSFLISLHNTLSQYNIQKNVNELNYTNLLKSIKVERKTEVICTQFQQGINLIKENLPDSNIDITFNEFVKNQCLFVSEAKINALKAVLDFDLNHKIEAVYATPSELIIKGRYVRLSEIDSKYWKRGLNSINIFATRKIFIDTDFNKIGHKLQLSIIAPVWEIVGSHNKILLDGADGIERTPRKANNGIMDGQKGEDGMVGLPGGTGGNFLGITGYVTGGILTVSANGGRGGPGQEGGNGAPGKKGQDPPEIPGRVSRNIRDIYYPSEDWEGFRWEENTAEDYLVVTRDKYIGYGKAATNGADGGNGGAGGLGGKPGSILIYDFSNGTNIRTSREKGSLGEAGSGGAGGLNAPNGLIVKVTCRIERYVFVAVSHCDTNDRLPNGYSSNGKPGLRGHGNRGATPPESPQTIKLTLIRNKFNEFANKNLIFRFGEKQVTMFYDKMLQESL